MSRPVCTHESHEATKATRWSSLTFIGTQKLEATDDEPAGSLELRNCECGSTLAMFVEVRS